MMPNGQLVASSNPDNLLTASLTFNATLGSYYVKIDGVGRGDPKAMATPITAASGSSEFWAPTPTPRTARRHQRSDAARSARELSDRHNRGNAGCD